MSNAENRSPSSEGVSINEYLEGEGARKWYRKKRWWLLGFLLVLAILGLGQFSEDGQGPDYITSELQVRSLDLSVRATGNLRPTNQVEVGSEISGRLDQVLVDVNDRVSRGQILAVINTDIIGDQIIQGRSALNSARADVQAAQATLDGDEAQLSRLVEVRRLSQGRTPSAAEVDQARAAVNRGKALLAASRASVASAAAQLSTAETQRSRAVIRSPVSGVVLARQIEPGQTVAANFSTPTLFVLAEDLAIMQLRVNVDEADVGQVQIGQQATFTVDAYPGRQFPARVERVDVASNSVAASDRSAAGQQVVSYEARLQVANAEGLLRPGMTASVTIETRSTGARMVVPNGALRFEPDLSDEEDVGLFDAEVDATEDDGGSIGVGSRQTVYTIDEGGILKEHRVVTGQTNGRFTVVRGATLREGMKIVTGTRSSNQND